MISSGRERSRLEVQIPAPDPRRAGQPPRSVVRRLHAQLARRVGIQQVIAQYAILDHHRPQRGQAFAVERRRSEPAHPRRQQHGIIVNDGQSPARQSVSPSFPARNEAWRQMAVARCRLEHRSDQRPRHLGREYDWRLLRGNPPRPQPPQRPPRRLLAHRLGRFEIPDAPRPRPPAVALHLAVVVPRQRRGGDSRIAGAIAAQKSARVGQHLPPGRSVEAAAIGIGDAGVGLQRRRLRSPRPFDPLRPGQRIHVVEVEVQIARPRRRIRPFPAVRQTDPLR